MADPKKITESPKITDTVLFEFTTTDSAGAAANPYKVDKVTIYYLTRDFSSGNTNQQTKEEFEGVDSLTLNTFYNRADVVKVFGTDDFPAWLSTDIPNASMDNIGDGNFELTWEPEFAREGDYILCFTWTPVLAADTLSAFLEFHLDGDTAVTTSIPTHLTDEDKYPTLLERYLPEYLQLKLSSVDLTPDTLTKLQAAVANGFIRVEDLVNQTVDLIDSNAVHERLILFLANLFNLNLRSQDQTRWRRQIKRAVPVFKQKGTLKGLTEGLVQAGITLNSLTQLWQVVSPFSWTESFVVADDETLFVLDRAVSDTSDFEIELRANGDDDYLDLTPASDYGSIELDSDGRDYELTWIGDTADTPIPLETGDVVKITYRVAPITDASLESKIQALPLADQRDETEVTYPPKNWNVKLIAETATDFDTCCPVRNPFADPVIYGKVRTEFPYSENIYNMEEYNGSLRDSTDPCDLK